MLMVLMALVDMGKTKVVSATRWLWLLLSGGLFAAPLGCEVSKGSDTGGNPDVIQNTDPGTDVPQVLYGPPPVDVISDANPQTDCGMVTYYGPQPCDSDAFCVQEFGPGWYCDKAAGYTDPCGGFTPWPTCRQGATDVIDDDVKKDVQQDCEPVVAYGPPPCSTDEDCKKYGPEWYCGKSEMVIDSCGTTVQTALCMQDMDVVPSDLPMTDCLPLNAYGPPPCSTDEDCKKFGPEWYCGKGEMVIDSCGTKMVVDLCTQAVDVIPTDVVEVSPDCMPAGWYGPMPCASDEECVKDFGEGWFCDKNQVVETGCGPTLYPTCMPVDKGDVPDAAVVDCGGMATFYGPMPCTSDEQCVKDYGEGFYCPPRTDPCTPTFCQKK